MELINKGNIKNVIRIRADNSQKGTYGRSLIVAGSDKYSGAAVLATTASIYSGSGLVTVASNPKTMSAINHSVPEAMTIDYIDTQQLLSLLPNFDVVAVGPGLDLNIEGTNILIESIIKNINPQQTIIIDASALNYISQNTNLLKEIKANVILTPHQMEWQRLSKIKIDQQNETTNIKKLDELSPNAVLVLKKHHSEIYYKGHTSYINIGNPGMATGGTGDTLAGMIAGFVAQFGFSKKTVEAALFTHSYIADKIYQNNYVVLPTNLISKIPETMKELSQIN
ncbi:NAD(P)H-hydrate dehydratase [Companilactobacillus metriopterae]|uniref:NAD(P)H-hydrate dehydratase n=1 Tax=Companilactobacillus metriopterae TaxID=1909267 RepID=UPI00100BA981|nr:NAD(P)H-hydrate dehydratase [Companilactobacillus metriopterae]